MVEVSIPILRASMKPLPNVPVRTYPPVPAASTPIEGETRGSAFWSLALFATLGGIFILYSRFFDIALNGFRIPRVVMSLTDPVLRAERPVIGVPALVPQLAKLVLGLCVWSTITVLTGVWWGGSMPSLLPAHAIHADLCYRCRYSHWLSRT